MDRRHFLGAMAAMATPSIAKAQTASSGRMRKIGWITGQRRASLEPYLAEVRSGLADLGFVEGKTIAIEYRFGDDDLSKVPALAADLVAQDVELIVAQGAAVAILATAQLPVPLVYVTSGDPVVSGLAESLSKPKGAMTGITFMAAEMNGKRLEILRDIKPAMKRLAVIGNPEHPGAEIEFSYARDKASSLGLEMAYYTTRSLPELQAAFKTIADRPVDAMSVFADGFAVQYREQIIAFGMAQKVPVVSGWAVFAQSGALCTYGPKLSSSYRRLSAFVAKILAGAKPADIPVERPTTFELVLNLRSAKQLGLAMPTEVVARADDVID
ncbi:ABC transporter substrate-binding protein [uncultured Alsobacter sp.]|uniref:ABC transporter substrate-binding protein n=1 Tax=uncultured Alsobacter sp. TaxID=1748258 RepID=UPI0025E5A82D|nr:ABC transporter substrate-binding protein [uncultured Alsobacter sp.]